jgi:hypothetical protein
MKALILFSAVLVISSCINRKEDIYDKISTGSEFKKIDMQRVYQIIPFDSVVFVLRDFSESEKEYFKPYLLAYSNSLHLISASYMPGRIEKIKGGVIYYEIHSERESRKHRFSDDLPKQFEFKARKVVQSRVRMSNKEITELKESEEPYSFTFTVKSYLDKYHFLRPSNLEKSTDFLIDTIKSSIDNIHFGDDGNTISFYMLNDGKLTEDQLIISENQKKQILESVWNQLLANSLD